VISFQDGPKPRNYLSRREQRRLLFLVLALGLAVILMCEARKPEHWQCFQTPDGKNGPRPVDMLPDDVENAEGGENGLLGRKLFPGVDQGLLKTIRDNTRFRDEEKAAWFNMLGVLKHGGEAELRRASIGRISWLQLNEQSAEYRGELVNVLGTICRAHRVDAQKNDLGIDGYYQVWLEPDDNTKRRIVVYCLELPEGFPTGMELAERARVTGFYFKRWLYMGQKDLETAPVLLAKTVGWKKTPAAASDAPAGLDSIYFLIAAAIVLSLLAIGYILYCTRGRPRKEDDAPVDFNSIIKLNLEEELSEERDK
jgi:hypothetical protein